MYVIFTGFILLSASCYAESGPTKHCPCASEAYCAPVNDWDKSQKEIVVITNRSSDYKKWLWQSLTTVIEWNSDLKSNISDDLMCYAHSQGKKYGFYVKDFPVNKSRIDSYVTETSSLISVKRADVVVINLLAYLGDCSYASKHVEGMINLTTTVLGEIKKNIKAKLLCLMPWQPPCFETNCDLGPALAKQCDSVIFSPESYNTYCSETCTAKATVSFSKIQIGVAEYRAAGFKRDQILIGVPWHGYNYTCQNGDKEDKWSGHFVCHLKTKTDNSMGSDVQVCDIEGSRVRIDVGDVVGKVPQAALLDSTYSEIDQAPFLVKTVKSGDNVTSHMTWFEDIGSLMSKYEAVNHFNIKGCVIFTADDLTYSNFQTNKQFDDHMWAWMLHSVISNGTTFTKETKMNMAGTVAGVGIGMFLLGFVLGAIILCIVFRRQKRLRPPFSHDRMTDEFKDDDHDQL